MIYTVDEVSDALDIPRPTLYRYLREYSIPHLRRSGKISIPEESFDRIREARELHREGLGTESVRRKLREEETGFDPAELTERLDRISEGLDKLHAPRPAEEAPPSTEALRSIAKKQDLLISAVSDLAERMDSLLSTNDRPHKVVARGHGAQRSVEEKIPPGRAERPSKRATTWGVFRAGVSTPPRWQQRPSPRGRPPVARPMG